MNAEQCRIFHEFADGFCGRSDSCDTLNDAIIAASQELELLRPQRDELLEACEAALEAICAGAEPWMLADVEARCRNAIASATEESS